MARPLAVLGLTFFTALWAFGILGETAAGIAAVLSVLLFLLCMAVQKLRQTVAFPCASLAVLAACVLFITNTEFSAKPIAALDGQTVTVAAHMTAPPEADGKMYTLSVDSVDGTPMQFDLYLHTPFVLGADYADAFVFTARLTKSGDRMYAYAPDVTLLPQKPTLTSRMLSLRVYAEIVLCIGVPGAPGAVLAALLTGDTDAIPAAVYNRMQYSGILHLFAVSGFNLSVFSTALLLFLEKRKLPRILTVLPPALIVLFLTVFTGCSRSCMRACLMILLMLVGRCFFRRTDALNSLGFSVLLIGLFDPASAQNVGFQMSVIGTLGVVLVSPSAEKLLSRIRIKPRILQTAVRMFLQAMIVSACITLMTLPVMLPVFGRVSLIAPLTNACLLAAAEWALVCAAIAVLLSAVPLLEFLQNLFLLISGLLARYCVAVSDFFGSLSFASVRTGVTAAIWTAGTLFLIAVALLLPLSVRKKAAYTAGVSIACMVLAFGYFAAANAGSAQITVLDTGNHSAVLVQSGGQSALIGCGSEQKLSYKTGNYTDALDYLILPQMTETESADASDFVRSVEASHIVVPAQTASAQSLFGNREPVLSDDYTCTVGNVQIRYRNDAGNAAALLQTNGKTMLLLFSPSVDLRKIPQAWLNADMLYVRSAVPPGLCAEKYAMVLVSCTPDRVQTARNVQAQGGFAAATGGQGDIVLTIDREGLVGIERGE